MVLLRVLRDQCTLEHEHIEAGHEIQKDLQSKCQKLILFSIHFPDSQTVLQRGCPKNTVNSHGLTIDYVTQRQMYTVFNTI